MVDDMNSEFAMVLCYGVRLLDLLARAGAHGIETADWIQPSAPAAAGGGG